jgi:hypothetical protein
MDKAEVIAKVKALDLPAGQYFLFGSAVLAAYDIRDARDIDMVVVPELFRRLRKEGWKRKWFFHGCLRRKCVEKDGIEAYSNAKLKSYRPKTEDIIERAEMVEGVPLMPLGDCLDFKKVLNRGAKDERDIALIEEYLNKSAK